MSSSNGEFWEKRIARVIRSVVRPCTGRRRFVVRSRTPSERATGRGYYTTRRRRRRAYAEYSFGVVLPRTPVARVPPPRHPLPTSTFRRAGRARYGVVGGRRFSTAGRVFQCFDRPSSAVDNRRQSSFTARRRDSQLSASYAAAAVRLTAARRHARTRTPKPPPTHSPRTFSCAHRHRRYAPVSPCAIAVVVCVPGISRNRVHPLSPSVQLWSSS